MTDGQSVLYRHAPQMRDYDSKAVAGVWWAPYVMFHCGFPNAASPSVNTDGLGIRYTIDSGGNRVSPEMLATSKVAGRPVSLVVGGSTAFGIGATSDAKTVPSLLNQMTDRLWLNLGMRSWVLSQNLVQFLFIRRLFDRIDTIVLYSGLNDLDIFMISELTTLPYGPFYGWREFFSRTNTEFYDSARGEYAFPTELGQMLARLHQPEGGRDIFLDLLDNCFAGWSMVAQHHGARVVFCLQPVHAWHQRAPSLEEKELMTERFSQYPKSEKLFEEETHAYRSWYRAALERLTSQHGMAFIDLNEAFDVPELDGSFLFVDPWHLTDRGSEVVARAIAQGI